ncbi:MAG: hypothetical protein ACOY93_20810 [Bacillota bacterium]
MLRILHQELSVALELPPERSLPLAPGSLWVDATLHVRNDGPAPSPQLSLLLYRLYRVERVAAGGLSLVFTQSVTPVSGEERRHVNRVLVDLPSPLEPGESIALTLRYGGVTAGAREVWPYMWDQVGRAYTLLRPDILWYPVAGEPDRGNLLEQWRQPFTYSLAVDLPDGFTAVAAGPTGEPGRFRSPAPRDRLDLAVAPFTALRAGALAVYHLPGSGAWGRATLGWMESALTVMGRLLEPRPAGELAFVQIPEGWGGQYSPGLILQEAGSLDDWFTAAKVVHEVAHFWTPMPDRPLERFSDESLAQYFQVVILDQTHGAAAAEANLDRYRRALERSPEAAALGLLRMAERADLLELVSRCKGPLALHDLRIRLGEPDFWALLRAYTRAERSTVAAFVHLLQARHPGPETEEYLDRWFR